MRSVVACPVIRTLDPSLLRRSLEVYETIASTSPRRTRSPPAESAGVDHIISFDRSLK